MSRSNIPRLSRLGALLVLLLLPTSAPARDARTLLEEVLPPAIAEYERALTLSDRDARLEGFERARLQFQRAIREGTAENADLWTNLGNAALGGESDRFVPSSFALTEKTARTPIVSGRSPSGSLHMSAPQSSAGVFLGASWCCCWSRTSTKQQPRQNGCSGM